ncbi:MAG: hypothetical protein ACQEQV_04335 [Fibrobacterota bacterium]
MSIRTKSRLSAVAAVSALLFFSLFTACDDVTGSDGTDGLSQRDLLGSWEQETQGMTTIFTFKTHSGLTQSTVFMEDTTTAEYEWRMEGDTVFLNLGDGELAYNCDISGNTLTLSQEGIDAYIMNRIEDDSTGDDDSNDGDTLKNDTTPGHDLIGAWSGTFYDSTQDITLSEEYTFLASMEGSVKATLGEENPVSQTMDFTWEVTDNSILHLTNEEETTSTEYEVAGDTLYLEGNTYTKQ